MGKYTPASVSETAMISAPWRPLYAAWPAPDSRALERAPLRHHAPRAQVERRQGRVEVGCRGIEALNADAQRGIAQGVDEARLVQREGDVDDCSVAGEEQQ